MTALEGLVGRSVDVLILGGGDHVGVLATLWRDPTGAPIALELASGETIPWHAVELVRPHVEPTFP